MMNYEIFKDVVKEKLPDYLPTEYENADISIHSVNKVNQVLDGLSILERDSTSNVSPTIYLNNAYQEYLQNEDINQVVSNLAERYVEAKKYAPDVREDASLNMENVKDNVVMVLVNTEQNQEMLQNMPHRDFQDLSIVYRWVIKAEEEGISSTLVNNNLAKQLGMNEEFLYKNAVENTKRIFPSSVRNMKEVIMEMMLADGMPHEMAEMMTSDIPDDRSMWVISNERGINGAVSMLYEDNLHKIADKLDSDLYIMPSSIHEVIAVSTSMGEPNELAQMVSEINMGQVSLDERLSNQVYHYDKDLRKLSLATDTPNKRLDGVVAEPQMIYTEPETSR